MPESPPLLILSSIPVFTRNLVWAAGHAGRPCWVMDAGPADEWQHCPWVLGSEAIDREQVGAGDEAPRQQVLEFIRRHEIAEVVAADTRCTRLLMGLRPELPSSVRPFPMPTAALFEQLHDKSRFDALLGELALPAPLTRTLHSPDEADGLLIPFPTIVKPTLGEGGEGITIADTPAALLETLRSRADLSTRPVVVQAYVPGRDIDMSLLADQGECVAWTVQQRADDGLMHFPDRNDVIELGRELTRRTGYHGVMHIDMRIDERDGSVVVIEANPRFWGSLSYSVWAGVNFLDLGLRLAAGNELDDSPVACAPTSPYLGVTRSSLPRILLGGRFPPRGLGAAERRAWELHHRNGVRSLRTWWDVVRREGGFWPRG